jgi:hypothetical protein
MGVVFLKAGGARRYVFGRNHIYVAKVFKLVLLHHSDRTFLSFDSLELFLLGNLIFVALAGWPCWHDTPHINVFAI